MSIRPRDPVRVLEILLKQTPRETMICNKDQFFAEGQTMEALGWYIFISTVYFDKLLFGLIFLQVTVDHLQLVFIKPYL